MRPLKLAVPLHRSDHLGDNTHGVLEMVVRPLERETKDSISLVSGNGLAAPNSEHLAVAEDQS